MTILNLGAGVQSTVFYLMGVKGELAFNCAVFSDLGEEPAPVYRHLEWLKGLGGPAIHVLDAGRLGDDLKNGRNSTGQRFAPIPAWTAAREGENSGCVRRQCTSEYKIAPIERFIRRTLLGLEPGQRMPPGTRITQLFGISLDEAGRAYRIKANVWLRENDPAGFARAVEIDDALRSEGAVMNRKVDLAMYIYQSCIPLREVKFTDAEKGQGTFELDCEGGCGL